MKRILWMTMAMMMAMLMPSFAAEAAGLEVQGAWVRLPPPVSDTAAVYAVFRNPGAKDVRITGVSVNKAAGVAASAMLHTMAGGRMHMLKSLDVPAGGEVRLAPGGMHIMLMGLKHALTAGEKVRLELIYADGTHQPIEAVVRDARGDAGGMGGMDHMDGMGGMHDMDGMGGMAHPH